MLKQLRQVVLEVELKASRQMTAGKAIKRPVTAMMRSMLMLISEQFVSEVMRMTYGKRLEKTG